jgi:spore coat polysaccharide biosynthesis protein SpsF
VRIIDAIIEARIGSSRLPGKVMYKINNIPIIELLVNRIKKANHVRKIIIATSTNNLDDKIIEWARKKKILFYRGSEEDVMSRVLAAAKYYNVKHILNITGDCPLIDPQLISQFIYIV